jgi:hypothetical protein
MRRAAVLGARASEFSGSRRLERETRHATGDQIHLAGDRRYPERMDHIRACELKFHTLVHRQAQLVCGLHDALFRHVLHPPPPLLAGHMNPESAVRRRRQHRRQHR